MISPTFSQTLRAHSDDILKLDAIGFSSEQNSAFTGLNIEDVTKVLSDHATDPQAIRRKAASLQQLSLQYRCAKSGKLLSDSTISSDGKNYEYNVLEL